MTENAAQLEGAAAAFDHQSHLMGNEEELNQQAFNELYNQDESSRPFNSLDPFHPTSSSHNKNPLDLPSSEFDSFASRNTANFASSSSSSPPLPRHSATSPNFNENHQPNFMNRFSSTHSNEAGGSLLQNQSQNSHAYNPSNSMDIQNQGESRNGESESVLDLSDPQSLEKWLNELGVSNIPNSLSEEIMDVSSFDPPPAQSGNETNGGTTSQAPTSNSHLTGADANGGEGARMKVNSLLSPLPTHASIEPSPGSDLFQHTSSSSSATSKPSTSVPHQSGSKSIDSVIAKHIEVLQKEIDNSNYSLSNESSFSSAQMPSLVLIAEANHSLLEVFPQDASHAHSVYGLHEHEIHQNSIHPRYTVAPMLGLSLITQILNSISIIRTQSRKEQEQENQDQSNTTSSSSSALPSLSPFLPSLEKQEQREIENIMVKSQLRRLKLNIDRSLSMARHHHKGSSPCIVKEWATRLRSQADELET